LARWFDCRQAMVVVQSATLIRWHRQGFRLCWRGKSTPGRPPLPTDLRARIRRIARDNRTWGEEHVADELLLTLSVRVSPRTVRIYLPPHRNHRSYTRIPSQCWRTFVRNCTQTMAACDFRMVVTATVRLRYVFILMEYMTCRILHPNVTARPIAPWSLQQLREAMPSKHGYRFLIHNGDHIASQLLDQYVRNVGLRVLKTPSQSLKANAPCERLLDMLRRERLAFVSPLKEHHLRHVLTAWVRHYNAGRPHMALGPGVPQPLPPSPVPLRSQRHRIPPHLRVIACPIHGGLHHEYRREEKVA
jgi:putative transposase